MEQWASYLQQHNRYVLCKHYNKQQKISSVYVKKKKQAITVRLRFKSKFEIYFQMFFEILEGFRKAITYLRPLTVQSVSDVPYSFTALAEIRCKIEHQAVDIWRNNFQWDKYLFAPLWYKFHKSYCFLRKAFLRRIKKSVSVCVLKLIFGILWLFSQLERWGEQGKMYPAMLQSVSLLPFIAVGNYFGW